jgi:hypothetical protein
MTDVVNPAVEQSEPIKDIADSSKPELDASNKQIESSTEPAKEEPNAEKAKK